MTEFEGLLNAAHEAAALHTYIAYKREKEVDALRLRPHPYEFALYYDILDATRGYQWYKIRLILRAAGEQKLREKGAHESVFSKVTAPKLQSGCGAAYLPYFS
jgi:hypothetical protein